MSRTWLAGDFMLERAYGLGRAKCAELEERIKAGCTDCRRPLVEYDDEGRPTRAIYGAVIIVTTDDANAVLDRAPYCGDCVRKHYSFN